MMDASASFLPSADLRDDAAANIPDWSDDGLS
jgi:hypothetical protein